MTIRYVVISALFLSTALYGQKKAPSDWQLLDPSANKIYGAGIEKAYQSLKDRKPQSVVVAVIDGGIDIDHEDLKDVIWTNTGEIAGNGIDDDKNGYADDIHGWSFLGGKNGDINHESMELARIHRRLDKKFRHADTTVLSPDDKRELAEFNTVRAAFLNEQQRNAMQYEVLSQILTLTGKIRKQNNGALTRAAVKAYVPENPVEKSIQKKLKLVLAFVDAKELEAQMQQGHEHFGARVKYDALDTDSIRKLIVGDDVDNPTERYYGSNGVKGPNALHGTHVAGIIAATRNNSLGIKGVAEHVKIMALRAIPDGDERDKDVANAIYYAVDNGARIINMSFGKYYSPEKKVVDDAVQYALSRDVLLVHAAGNDARNTDKEPSYPSRELLCNITASNWLEVGANAYKPGKTLIATFSNYGKKSVDLFAPGVDIYSTFPGNKYGSESGTSMAAPVASGVAAIVRAYFPELKAYEVKELLLKTAVPYKKKVKKPGSKKEKVKLNALSNSGGIINAHRAVLQLLHEKRH